jgi:hypothetical protein
MQLLHPSHNAQSVRPYARLSFKCSVKCLNALGNFCICIIIHVDLQQETDKLAEQLRVRSQKGQAEPRDFVNIVTWQYHKFINQSLEL